MLTKYIYIILVAICNLIFKDMAAQALPNIKVEISDLDPSIRYGHLPNGFTYFIKTLDNPDPKLHLRLYNKAGTNQESIDQLEASHAVEHLAFKSSKGFPSGIRNSARVDSIQMDTYDILAYNGTSLTQYIFDAPVNNIEALKTGLSWFKDIVGAGLIFSEKDIAQVRGELRQEFINRNASNLSKFIARTTMYSKIFPCSRGYSKYSTSPGNIGTEPLNRFYKDWYRPDLFGISIVGNIEDIDNIERKIRKTFSGINNPENSKELVNCDSAYYNLPPQFTIVDHSSESLSSDSVMNVDIHLFFRDEITENNLQNTKGLRRLIKRQILREIINRRFRDISNEYKSPIYYAEDPFDGKNFPPVLEIILSSNHFGEEEVLKKAILTLRQLQTFGALEAEWKEIKEKWLQNISRNNVESASYWMNEIMAYYNTGEALPQNKKENLHRWFINFSLEDFNKYAENFLLKMPEDIGIIAPTGNKALKYPEEEVRSWIKKIYSEKVYPYELPVIPDAIMAPEDISRLQEVNFTDLGFGVSGAREVILKNGVKVILKSFKPNPGPQQKNIKVHGFSLKGARCFDEDYYYSAINAASIVRNSGINDLDKFELGRYLSNTSIVPGSIYPYILDRETGIEVKSDLEDLEIALQLIYLYFTDPNKNKFAFEDWKDQEFQEFISPKFNRTKVDFNNVIRGMTQENSMYSVVGKKVLSGKKRYDSVEKTDFGMALEIYKNLFRNAKEFTFLISGDFNPDAVLPLVQKYLGNLPNLATTCLSQRDNKKILPTRSFIEIEAPNHNQVPNILYGIRIIERATITDEWREQLKFEALAEITYHKAWNLRFEKGYSLYMINVYGLFNLDMKQYELGATFECIPEEYSMIRKEFKQVILNIKDGLISDEIFQKGMERLTYLYGTERANNPRIVHQRLFDHYRYQQPWISSYMVENYINSLTVEDIMETANKYFQKENLYEFVMKTKQLK